MSDHPVSVSGAGSGRGGLGRHPDPAEVDAEYARDTWQAPRLGIQAPRGRASITFAGLSQPWLRQAVKAWCQWRLATGCAWGTANACATTLSRFSAFLAASEPGAVDGSVITRATLERFSSWLVATGLAPASRTHCLILLRGFLEDNRRHRWLAEIGYEAAIYQDDLPRRPKSLPRFVSEFVMAQIEDPDALDQLDPTIRHLVIVLIDTGLRATDACTLPFNPVVADSVGAPCLRFRNAKAREEHLVPLTERAAKAIGDQQTYVAARWSEASPWLFPDTHHDNGADRPISYRFLHRRLRNWQTHIDLRDEAGLPITVSCHQFRHTLGTRLINSGVPQHIVQRVLTHASPGMTDVYARLHDSTIRIAFDRFQQQRVDIAGRVLAYDPESPAADAEWLKHNLARIQASLPNGYCGRPPQQECPHPNACLTCPQFQTTVEFLPTHRQHAKHNAQLLELAQRHGQHRLADNHRRIQDALERIIPALEALDTDADAQPEESNQPDDD